ncbi:MAG: mechanosensitive ion channel family protein [Rhizobiaceae bacterium]
MAMQIGCVTPLASMSKNPSWLNHPALALSVAIQHVRIMKSLARILSLFAIVLATMLVSQASDAQLGLATSKNEAAPSSGLELLLDEARKDGSTVIVVQPPKKDASISGTASSLRAQSFLNARKEVRAILLSSPQLLSNIQGTLKAASPDGGWFWLFRAVGTALLGLVIGWYATRPIIRWAIRNVFTKTDIDPETSADRISYLLSRALFALIYVLVYLAVAMLVAIILDSGHEPSRRAIFEIIVWYCAYRFLRHGISWNLFAGEMPKYRLVNLSDDEAVRLHSYFHIGVALFASFAAIARFLGFTGADQIAAGLTGVMTVENIKFLQICAATLATVGLIAYMIGGWKAWQHIFAPSDPTAEFYTLRKNIARVVPVIVLFYAFASLGMFVFRLALDLPSPGELIVAPFVIFYLALVVYGLTLIVIQALYNRRINKFEALAAAEHQRQEEERAQVDTDAGEVMEVGPNTVTSEIFEYQPLFRSLFENAALAIIATISLRELARVWGVPVGQDGNMWSAALNIILTIVLGWLACDAVKIFVDKKLEEEGGEPAQVEMGGDGGGAGVTRTATLLPILRYALIVIIFAIAGMVVLSRMGIDIAPVFAGAGVIGIAVGFGAQTLIRDIFSGAFFLMDDAFRRGEYVEIEGVRGTVEKISIRSFQLRHHLGALHTIPFGEIKQLTNYSRDWVLMKLPLRVTYDTDTEKVRKLVKKLGQELLNHPQVGHTFMQPLKSQGVYKMEDSAMIIRVKYMTKPGEQFVTRKVVYESIQDLFAREGIHFAHKEVTVRLADKPVDELTEEEKQAVTAAARSVIDQEEQAMQSAAGGKPADGGR